MTVGVVFPGGLRIRLASGKAKRAMDECPDQCGEWLSRDARAAQSQWSFVCGHAR